ncbi:hypothetical protein BDP81DRAFT_425408 [Colletotrichum phormii]|uniref:Secreted protein n=1 Tax=Colletotrichum phormii TaxID=359342 RepID=A0AAI9ZSY8_9PEZI|nr:uncharacterized protein BDP81DRAFT_425408 [Colletotrichum phormii]KAK1637528.1 hypothetical protein BDP81DRAFT_425408 [Colletotrichum phormii]
MLLCILHFSTQPAVLSVISVEPCGPEASSSSTHGAASPIVHGKIDGSESLLLILHLVARYRDTRKPLIGD